LGGVSQGTSKGKFPRCSETHQYHLQILNSARFRDVGEGQALKGHQPDDVTGAKALNANPVPFLDQRATVLEPSEDLRKPAPATAPALATKRQRGLTRTWTSTNVLDMNATVVHANMRTNSSNVYSRIGRRAACVEALVEPEKNPREPAKMVQYEPVAALNVHLKKTNPDIPQKSALKVCVPK
jgi:hypothetical protein